MLLLRNSHLVSEEFDLGELDVLLWRSPEILNAVCWDLVVSDHALPVFAVLLLGRLLPTQKRLECATLACSRI